MNKLLFISIVSFAVYLIACKKTKNKNDAEVPSSETAVTESYGPYGKSSKWKSIGGDTLFSESLTLTHFYTEKNSPCNICYYQQNYSLWTDYDYTYSVSACAIVNDTLTMTDVDTERKALFKREK